MWHKRTSTGTWKYYFVAWNILLIPICILFSMKSTITHISKTILTNKWMHRTQIFNSGNRMHAKSVIFCAISTVLKNHLSKKKGCQRIFFFFLEEPLKVSAKCNSFKHFSVFTLFSLSHPEDQQLLYQKTNVSIKRVLKWNQKSKINVIHIYESVFRLGTQGSQESI